VVDTHTHLELCDAPDRDLVGRAREAGVERMLTIGIDEGSNRAAIGAAASFPEVFAAVGRHPNSAAGFGDADAAAIEALAETPEVRAIGETGLDFYRDRAPREDQRRAFAAQIEIARRVDLPLVIHLRDSTTASDRGEESAVAEAFATLGERAGGATVVLHCYSAGPDRVGEAVERGWYLSFAGNVTYPKAVELHESATRVPLELLLVETDAPFLSPQPVRGKPNEPANVVSTARFVSELRELPYDELEAAVQTNAARVFGW